MGVLVAGRRSAAVKRGAKAGALITALLLATLPAADGGEPVANGGEPVSAADGIVTVCHVPARTPDQEATVKVPRRTAEVLLRTSLSYLGPCASYGQSAPLGNGRLTVYAQADGRTPRSIGLVFKSATLDGLPYHPPTAGLWCHDRDGDGVIDQHSECSGGYENALELSEAFTSKVDTPFTYLLVNWNPMGHIPPGVWDRPHFDIHFYLNDNAERLKIRPGPCPVLVNCDDYEIGKILPAPRYVAPDYIDVDALEPAMGNHLIDPTTDEFNGGPFTHTFIYGSWGGHITFYEPMVTHEWFAGLRDGAVDDACFAMKLPQAWEQPGWYPTRYCLRHRENRDELTASLEDFVYRAAG